MENGDCCRIDDSHHGEHAHDRSLVIGRHVHRHRHAAVLHAHTHLPDIHHRHDHDWTPESADADYDERVMSGSSRFAALLIVCVAFLVAAAHLGMGDHSTHLTDTSSHPVMTVTATMTGAAAMPSASEHGADLIVTTSGDRYASGGMTLAMACQFMALAVIVGFGVRRLLAAARSAHVLTVFRTPVVVSQYQVARPKEPPGLTMLCVARC